VADQELPQLHLDNQLCFAIHSSSRAVVRAYTPLLDELGLTYPQYLVMLVLWERNELTVSEIGERLFLESPTLTPLLKRMEVAGFVARNRSGADERQVFVSLTPSGKRLRERAVAIPGCVAAAMECAPGEIDALRSRLTDMRSKVYKNAACGSTEFGRDMRPFFDQLTSTRSNSTISTDRRRAPAAVSRRDSRTNLSARTSLA
jgi:DNA-binding MarR family transcriptional regulator